MSNLEHEKILKENIESLKDEISAHKANIKEMKIKIDNLEAEKALLQMSLENIDNFYRSKLSNR